MKKMSSPKSDALAPTKNNHDTGRSLVSIGFPVYNGERYMRQAIDSLIVQDYDNFELIISDNASTDATKDICEEYARIDKRIKYSRNSSNLGAGANGIKVLGMAHGEFYMWAAHDDLWDKSYISKCVSMLQEHPRVVMCCSEINFIDSKGNPKIDSGYRNHKNIGSRSGMSLPERIHELINRMGWYAFYGVWRTGALRKIDFSASNIQGYGGDVVFLLTMMLIGDFLKVEESLFYYRIADKEKTTEDYLSQIQGSLTDKAFRAYTYLAVELYKIILRSNLVKQTKAIIRADFLNTLSHQNNDWFGRIARENYPQGSRGGPAEKEKIIESFILQRAEREYTDGLVERKKILAFFPHNLMPPKTGAHKRCIDLLLSLRAAGHDVTLVSSTLFTDAPWQKESIDKLKDEHDITVLLHQGSSEDHVHLRSHNPQKDWNHFTPPSLMQFFSRIYDTLQPEIVFINYAMWSGLVEDKKYDASVLCIEMHDMVTTNQKMQNHAWQAASNNPASTGSISSNFIDEGFYRQIDTAPSPPEFKAYDRFDIVTAIAPAEAELVDANTSRPEVVTLPHVFKANYCKNTYSLSPVFVIGNNIFNFQGYAYFTNKILPIVLAAHPNFVLRIVGGACKQLQQVPGIEPLGFVPDLASIYAHASFAICPLIGGTGQQIKIIEAMSYGVPVVALANVSASSPIIHENNGFVAGSAKEFASYIVTLLNDHEQCRKLGEAARQTIFEAHFKNKNYTALHKSIKRKLDAKKTMVETGIPLFCQNIAQPTEEQMVIGKNILFLRPDSIGDNILASSMLPYIKAKYSDAKITVLCQDHIAELYESSPFVDSVIGFNRLKGYQDGAYRNLILQQLQALHADLALNSLYSRDPLYDLFALNSGAHTNIAFNGNLCNISATDRDKNNKLYTKIITDTEGHKPEIERHRDFLEGIGISVSKLEPAIWLKPEDEEFAEKFFKDNNLDAGSTVCLFAGAQNDVRIYEGYGIALSNICKSYGFSVIGLGGIGDSGINSRNLEAIGGNTIDLSGKTSLRQTAAILKRCRLAVGAETGLAHMARAVGTPSVILLGGGHFGRFMPYSRLTSIVCLPLECYGCNWLCKYSHVHCVKDIGTAVIAEAVRQTLEKESDKPRVFVQGTSLWEGGAKQPQWQSFHKFLNIAEVEIIPVGTMPSFTEGIWKKLSSMNQEAQFQFLKEAADEFIQHGEKLFSYNDFEGAEFSFRRALELHNNSPETFNNLGVLYTQTGDNEKALQNFESAVKLQPDNAIFLKNQGDFYYVVQKDSQKALQMYAKGLSFSPDDVEILMTLGNIAIENGRLESAKKFYHRVLNIDPQNIEASKIIDHFDNQNKVMTTEQAYTTAIDGVNQSEEYLISAIVSAYNSERFIRGCIEDLEAQTIADQLEIVIVDSCSPQNERAIVEEYQQKYSNIRYVRTEKRETVYAAWNRGIKASSGKYITNANTDDRHRYDAFEIMVNELERKPEIALVYADVIMTEKENETFDRHTPCGDFKWHDWDRNILLKEGCFMGPQPMWRRSVHDEYGYFDEAMVTSGDYEFWLRISQTHDFYHIKTPLGLYLKSPESIEHSNRGKQREENHQILSLYRDAAKKARVVKSEAVKEIPSLIHTEFVKGLTSIIIPVKSIHLDECVAAIKQYTEEPHEITFLDHGAAPKLKKQYAKALKENSNYKVIKIDRKANFTQILNEGINASTGEYIVLLFDDVVVGEGWLSDMFGCLNGGRKIGIVGAMADDASGLQKVEGIDFKSLEDRRSFRARNRHRRIQTSNLDGFCMLFRRDLLIKIGLWDEMFGQNKHVFDDFCVRAVLEGYHNVIAGDVFVHNLGGINRLLTRDKTLFDKKWSGLDASTPLAATTPPSITMFEKMVQDAQTDGSWERAIQRLTEELNLNHTSEEVVSLCNALGYSYFMSGLPRQAEIAFKSGLAINPQDIDLLNNIASLYLHQEEYDKASDYVTCALRLDPHDVGALRTLGDCAIKLAKFDEALRAYEQIKRLSPATDDIDQVIADLARLANADATPPDKNIHQSYTRQTEQ